MNTKPLLIVESPSKAKTISKYLGGEFDVIASVGHIKDLPTKELGLNIDNHFEMTLVALPDKKAFISELRKKSKNAPRVVIATDPDREGEAIADHIASEIKSTNLERVQFTEITRAGILEGMENSRPIDTKLVDAQKSRRIIDRLVGYKISPILWNTLQKTMKYINTTLSAGRVQSAAVKIIVEKDRERMTFVSSQYFDLKSILLSVDKKSFEANLFEYQGKKLARGKDFDKTTGELIHPSVVLLNKSDAEKLINELDNNPWKVAKIDEKPSQSKPRPPFTTSTLQQEASRKLRFSARNTMRAAQQLYEAGFITYMRTDSTHLSQEGFDGARQDIVNLFGKEYLPVKPVQYVTKVKNAQEAHEAIRPAGSRFKSVETVIASLGKNAGRLYELIYKRTLASQMLPAKLKQTVVVIQNGKALFRARGKVILFPGYMRAYVEGSDDPDRALSNQELILPPLKIDQELECQQTSVEQHNTKAPARYTEASLVKELESRGIGRPSTYAAIIETIQKRDYVVNSKGSLTPTFLGVALTQLLENHFAPLVDSAFTADMENSLDGISTGAIEALPFIEKFYFGDDDREGLSQMLEHKVDIREACTVPINSKEQDVQIRIGKFGPYLETEDQTKSIPSNLYLGDITPEKALELLSMKESAPKPLGEHPDTHEDIFVKQGPYGPYVQLGDSGTRKSIPKDVDPEEVTIDFAVQLLSLPKIVGTDPESGEDISADYGRYGPYLRKGKSNAKLTPPLTPLNVTLEQALELLKNNKKGPVELRSIGKHPKTGEEILIKDGRYGPYATDGKINASLPRDSDPLTIEPDDIIAIIDKKRAAGPTKRKRRRRKK